VMPLGWMGGRWWHVIVIIVTLIVRLHLAKGSLHDSEVLCVISKGFSMGSIKGILCGVQVFRS